MVFALTLALSLYRYRFALYEANRLTLKRIALTFTFAFGFRIYGKQHRFIIIHTLKLFIDSHEEFIYLDFKSKTKKTILETYLNKSSEKVAQQCKAYARRDRKTGLDAILNYLPEKDVVIFVDNFLRAGQTIDTKHVLLVIDLPTSSEQAEDTVAQGLVGRCCGYGKEDHKVHIITNKPLVQGYEHWLRTGKFNEHLPCRRFTIGKDGKFKLIKTSAYRGDAVPKKKPTKRVKKLKKITLTDEDGTEVVIDDPEDICMFSEYWNNNK